VAYRNDLEQFAQFLSEQAGVSRWFDVNKDSPGA